MTKTTYTDPEWRFSFLYPSDWEMDAPENRFTKTFRGNCSAPENIIGWASVEVRLIFGLEHYVDIIISIRASSEIPNFRLLEDVNCAKISNWRQLLCNI